MLSELTAATARHTETGVVVENMLDGYYRVNINGAVYTARNQTGTTVATASVVSVASTSWGRFIVSGAARHAVNVPTIIIRG